MVPAGRQEERKKERGRGHLSQIGHLRTKGRKAEKKPRKRTGQKKTPDLRLHQCIRGSGRGKETEQKRLSEESSLVIAKSIHMCE